MKNKWFWLAGGIVLGYIIKSQVDKHSAAKAIAPAAVTTPEEVSDDTLSFIGRKSKLIHPDYGRM